ncbi:hypothetical protein [Mesobacillus campisalis]|uniref:hypothetical protein n=1 Tax=Mesobacillus campisalis TaxID=1408103 RepID=UPI0012E248A8|nr:hypothetical protein [Mesobacillus campisalis]
MKLKIYEVIHTKEMLRCELLEGYYAIYQETESREFELDNNVLIQKDILLEKTVTLFKGNAQSTLQKIKSYPVAAPEGRRMEEILFKDFPEIFKHIAIKKVV